MHTRDLVFVLAAALACHRPARQPDAGATPAADSSASAPGPSLRPGRQADSAPAAQEDTARGIVAVVGTDRFLHVVLKQPGGTRGITLIGEETRAMSSVAGADVWATGNRLPNGDLQVSRFVVRAVDGVAATDGTLVLSGGRYYIVTADSARHVINNLPDVLRQQVGKRVWATGQLVQGPVTFGVVEAPTPRNAK